MPSSESEPLTEYLRVRDPQSGGVIICCNRTHVRNTQFLSAICGGDLAAAKKVPILDVTSCRPRNDSQPFSHDTFVFHKEVPRYCRMLVDFACIVRKHLECSGLVVVHCKNGRSRSPNVILAYMVLSHLFPNCTNNLTLSFATDWLTTAFREQRPTIASGSANFPNFEKFQNVIKALEMDVFVKAPWIGERIAENMARLTEEGTRSDRLVTRARSHVLAAMPASGISSQHVQGLASTETTRNRRRVETMPMVKSHPDRHVVGRRVKFFDPETELWKAGIICQGPLAGDKWIVTTAAASAEETSGHPISATQHRESGKHILALFRRGVRVLVNYQTQGELYLGTVAQWDGGSRVSVRYDDDRRTWSLSDAEISSMRLAPAGAPLPRNFPKELYKHYAAAKANEKRIVDAKMLARRQKVALRPAGHASRASFSSLSAEDSSSEERSSGKSSPRYVAGGAAFISRPEGGTGVPLKESTAARRARLKRTGSSGFRGVIQRRIKSYESKGSGKYLGTFPSAEEAAIAYDRAFIAAFGRTGNELQLNFPNATYVIGGDGDAKPLESAAARKARLNTGMTGFRGVVKRGIKSYRSKCCGKDLGTFPSAEEAAIAYDRAFIAAFGRTGNELQLNFPNPTYVIRDGAAESPESAAARKARLKTGMTGFRGVVKRRQSYVAVCNGTYLGIFRTPEDAAKAYDRAFIAAFGRTGNEQKLNFLNATHIINHKARSSARKKEKASARKKKKVTLSKRDFDPSVLAGRAVFCQKITATAKPKYVGRVQKTGSIKCSHCEKVFTIASFATHSGRGASNNGWKIVKSKFRGSIFSLEELYAYLLEKRKRKKKKEKKKEKEKDNVRAKTKKCAACMITKKKGEFIVNALSADGLEPCCKVCVASNVESIKHKRVVATEGTKGEKDCGAKKDPKYPEKSPPSNTTNADVVNDVQNFANVSHPDFQIEDFVQGQRVWRYASILREKTENKRVVVFYGNNEYKGLATTNGGTYTLEMNQGSCFYGAFFTGDNGTLKDDKGRVIPTRRSPVPTQPTFQIGEKPDVMSVDQASVEDELDSWNEEGEAPGRGYAAAEVVRKNALPKLPPDSSDDDTNAGIDADVLRKNALAELSPDSSDDDIDAGTGADVDDNDSGFKYEQGGVDAVSKSCCACNVVKARTAFYHNSTTKDGLWHRCISCYKELNGAGALAIHTKTPSVRHDNIDKAEDALNHGQTSQGPVLPDVTASEKQARLQALARRLHREYSDVTLTRARKLLQNWTVVAVTDGADVTFQYAKPGDGTRFLTEDDVVNHFESLKSSARKTNSKRLANKHVGKTIMRAVLHPSTQALLDTVKAKVIEFIPRNRESGTPSLWRIRHENGKEEIIDYSRLTQCLELKERSDTEMKMAEFVKENEWRLEDLQTSLCENFEGLTPSAASKMLKGWTVGIGSATTARITYNFMSPEGKRFRSRLEVIRYFAGQNTKEEEHTAKSLDARVGEKTPEKDKKRLPARKSQPATLSSAVTPLTLKKDSSLAPRRDALGIERPRNLAIARRAASSRKKNAFIGMTVSRSILDPNGQVIDTIEAKVTRHFPQKPHKTIPALWQIRHEDGDVEDLYYAELVQSLELHSRLQDEIQRAEYSRQNHWRIAVLANVLCEHVESITAGTASEILKGWSVKRATFTATRATFAYESPEGQRFRSTAAVVRHFAEMSKKKRRRAPGSEKLPLSKRRAIEQ